MKKKHLSVFLFSFVMLLNLSFSDSILESLPTLKNFTAGRVSSYDRSWGNADFLIDATGTVTLAEIEGPGAVTHIWVTINSRDKYHLRNLVLKVYWDDEPYPSIQSPIGDFFGLGHGMYYHYYSRPLGIGTNNGMNAFWYMPFAKKAKITLTNEGTVPVSSFYYYVDYRRYDKDDPSIQDKFKDMGYFHAFYNQAMPPQKGNDYLILAASGEGHYVGCNMSIELNSPGWWGEGDDKIFVDGDTTKYLYGTGSEDYFCGAWCYGESYYSLYFGCPLRGKDEAGGLWNVYRYHIEDPIPFKKDIKVMIEAIHSNREDDVPDNYSSVAYWYQKEPHAEFPDLPPAGKRLPINKKMQLIVPDSIEAETLKVIKTSSGDKYAIQDMGGFPDLWSNNSQLWLLANSRDDFFEISVDVKDKGYYCISGYITKSYDYGTFDIYIDDEKLNSVPVDGYSVSVLNSGKIIFGKTELSKGKHILKVVLTGKNPASSNYMVGIDCLTFEKAQKESATDSVIIDNKDLAIGFYTEGKWKKGSGGEDYSGDVCWAMKGNGESKAYWKPKFAKKGIYSVYVWYGADPANDHASNAPFTIVHKNGEDTIWVNLKTEFGLWKYLGDFEFSKGSSGYVMTTNQANGNVLADAVKFEIKKKKNRFLFF